MNENTPIDKVKKELFGLESNSKIQNNSSLLFEQYKLLVDSAQKAVERFEASNNLFMASNSFIFTVIGFCINGIDSKPEKIPLMGFLVLVGLITSASWIRVTKGYKRISVINVSLIRAFEELLPSRLFSYKYQAETEEGGQKRVNIIVTLESILPKLFLCVYGAGLVAVVAFCLGKL